MLTNTNENVNIQTLAPYNTLLSFLFTHKLKQKCKLKTETETNGTKYTANKERIAEVKMID